MLCEQTKICGLKYKNRYELFGQIFDRLMVVHAPIADAMGSGAGKLLQRQDSAIALAVLWEMASHWIPCLSVHDSFIVPRFAAQVLKTAMLNVYRQKIGFGAALKAA